MNRFIVFLILGFSCSLSQADTPNLLVITVDDMSCDSAGVFDGVIPDLTPNMDQLASEGLRFEMAHVQVGNCYPSRNVMFSGRYPHSSGVEGFYQVQNDYPVFCDVMQKAGYLLPFVERSVTRLRSSRIDGIPTLQSMKMAQKNTSKT